MKWFLISLFFFVISLFTVIYLNQHHAPIDVASKAVNQVDDSIEGAVEWKETALAYKLMYIVPLFFLLTSIFTFTKNK